MCTEPQKRTLLASWLVKALRIRKPTQGKAMRMDSMRQ
ncbi:MAG: hypothetical protein H6Q30_337 [Bacteroidetes bacterium]|nr:hypothetical protein [Bacteroidota bacterium]